MATGNEYRDRLLPLLRDIFDPYEAEISSTEAFSPEDLAESLGRLLEELERQHYGAVRHLQALLDARPTDPWEGDGELAMMLYFLHHPPTALQEEIDTLPELKALWNAMAQAAAPPLLSFNAFHSLTATLASGTSVMCNKWGDIYGTQKYEQFDIGWAWTLKNTLMNHIPRFFGAGYGIANFVTHEWPQPMPLQAGPNGKLSIAIIGDWGSGRYHLSGLPGSDGPACAVMETIAQLPSPPDYLIHLGDTYYSGTGRYRSPVGEETHNLVDVLRQYPQLAQPGRCFTLNSNHEMYGGAYGYYADALSDPLFSGQRGCSYFALAFGNWIIAGLDSAYFDPSPLYMEGGLGKESINPQYQFLKQIKASGKKSILMSHHTGITTDGNQESKHLWHEVTQILRPHYWYWGHTHLGVVYSDQAYSSDVKTRCIGHSSMPFAIPPGMEQDQGNVDWYSNTPLDPGTTRKGIAFQRPRAKNGFAILTLTDTDIQEQIYDIGNTHPVWSS